MWMWMWSLRLLRLRWWSDGFLVVVACRASCVGVVKLHIRSRSGIKIVLNRIETHENGG